MARIARRSRSKPGMRDSRRRIHASEGAVSRVTGAPRVVAPRGLRAFSLSGQAKMNCGRSPSAAKDARLKAKKTIPARRRMWSIVSPQVELDQPKLQSRRHNMRHLLLSAAIAATASASAFAQKPEASGAMAVQTAPGKGVVTNTVRMTATVEAIDTASRTVTLKGPGGNLVPIVAGPEVKNFDQIKVGDRVLVRYAEALSLELKK